MMQVLWNSLSIEGQWKTHANKRVSDISTTETGVVVSCNDGTSYEGSMVIGADGAYSVVRKHMRLMALRDRRRENMAAFVNEERPYLISYPCLWIHSPVLPNIKVGDANEIHGPAATIQLFVGEDSAVIGVYEKLEESTREPPRYTSADEQSFRGNMGPSATHKGWSVNFGPGVRAEDGIWTYQS